MLQPSVRCRIMVSNLSNSAWSALGSAVGRRITRLLTDLQRREPFLSRILVQRAATRRFHVPVELGSAMRIDASYDLASAWSRFGWPGELTSRLDNEDYFDLVANFVADAIAHDIDTQTQQWLYGETSAAKFFGLPAYAPLAPAEWVGGLSPDLPGWQPQLEHLMSTDPIATVRALLDLSLACSDDVEEPSLIAAGERLAIDVIRGFQPQQRMYSFRGGVTYFNVGAAEMFVAPNADTNAAFVLHPRHFAMHDMPASVSACRGQLVTRTHQQLVCTRRYLVGRLQRYAPALESQRRMTERRVLRHSRAAVTL
jgi:hypothetical protein